MRDHNIAGAVVSLLPNFIQPILWLMVVGECVNHIVGGITAALHLLKFKFNKSRAENILLPFFLFC